MRQTAYVSCPMDIPQNKLTEVINYVDSLGVCVHSWKRETSYNKGHIDAITKCDYFVVILPNMIWSATIHNLSSGILKELQLAIELKKLIFIAYKSKDGLKIYRATNDNYAITGIAGTSNSLQQLITEDEDEDEDEEEYIISKKMLQKSTTGRIICGSTDKSIDRRVLLII